MPAARDSAYPMDWVNKAAGDFRRVKRRLDEGDVEDAAVHLQQAIEKYLKAFLLSKGWSLKRIHDLEALLDDAIRFMPELEDFRPLVQQVTGYYLIERYPTFEALPSRREVSSAYDAAKLLIRALRREVVPRRRK